MLLIAGGVHAAMVGSLHPTPIATLPFLSPHSAVVAFFEGVLKYATAWEALREDAVQKTGMTLEQVRERLRSVLSLTDITRFPIPKNPQAVIFVAATVSPCLPRAIILFVLATIFSIFILHNLDPHIILPAFVEIVDYFLSSQSIYHSHCFIHSHTDI